jgi:antitoxin component YwqK of YwqJK toxin-antitoxin module
MKMKNKSITFSLFFLCFFLSLNAQKITLEELQTICNNKNFETTNKLLLAKNYEINKTEKSDEVNIISWTFDQTIVGKTKNLATFSIFNYDGTTNKAILKFKDKGIYANISNEIIKLGYAPEKDEFENGNIISNYSSLYFYLKLSFKKTVVEGENNGISYTAYEVQISKKGGIDDVNNGLKTELYNNRKPRLEYTLKDGKTNGAIKYFNEDGTIAKTGFMAMGLEKGVFTEFIYDGNSGKLIQKDTGEMFDGKKKGRWLLNEVNSGDETNLSFINFVDGTKEGTFSKVQNDSICFGYYKNNLLEGKYTIYTSEKDLEPGATIETDTLKLKKVISGFFSNNRKNGYWKTYDVDGTLILEGNYENDKKTGNWSHYYSIYIDDNNNMMDYSGKLFLEENYKYGKLNGESKRFSTLEEVEFPCENDNSKKCSKMDFKKINEIANNENGLLHGNYEYTNENNETIEKGIFTKGKKSGKWQLLNDSEVVVANKNTIEIGEFINDKKQGKWERLKNDKIVESYFYNDNLLNGEHIYTEKGNPKEKRKFQNKKLVSLELFDEDEKIKTKYKIEENEENYRCEKTDFLGDGTLIKNFLVTKNSGQPVDCRNFNGDFENAKKVADGFYQKKMTDNNIFEEGNFKINKKWGKWTTFYYEQKIKTEFDYNESGEIKNEFYFDLKKNEPFSGEFEFKYDDNTGSEERKIKDGFRNGTTRYKDAKDKTIRKESYKDGVLKVKE